MAFEPQHRTAPAGLTLIMIWLQVRVLPAPPRSPAQLEFSPSRRNTRIFCGLEPAHWPVHGLCEEGSPPGGGLDLSSLAPGNPFPGARRQPLPETRFACSGDRFAGKDFEATFFA